MNPSRFALVIFDCDGVLVDSELITNRIFANMLNELGIPVTLEDMFEQFVGHSMATCLERIAGLLGRPVPERPARTSCCCCMASRAPATCSVI